MCNPNYLLLGAFVVIYNPFDQLLVVIRESQEEGKPELHKYAGQICFPGGEINPGETAQQAAYREFWEETDRNIENIPLYYKGFGEQVTRSGAMIGFYVFYGESEYFPVNKRSQWISLPEFLNVPVNNRRPLTFCVASLCFPGITPTLLANRIFDTHPL